MNSCIETSLWLFGNVGVTGSDGDATSDEQWMGRPCSHHPHQPVSRALVRGEHLLARETAYETKDDSLSDSLGLTRDYAFAKRRVVLRMGVSHDPLTCDTTNMQMNSVAFWYLSDYACKMVFIASSKDSIVGTNGAPGYRAFEMIVRTALPHYNVYQQVILFWHLLLCWALLCWICM